MPDTFFSKIPLVEAPLWPPYIHHCAKTVTRSEAGIQAGVVTASASARKKPTQRQVGIP